MGGLFPYYLHYLIAVQHRIEHFGDYAEQIQLFVFECGLYDFGMLALCLAPVDFLLQREDSGLDEEMVSLVMGIDEKCV